MRRSRRNGAPGAFPGGKLLLTVSALAAQETPDSDRRRIPPAGLCHLLESRLPAEAQCAVDGLNDAVAAAASMLGLAVEEMGPLQLEPVDRRYLLFVSPARVRRPAGHAE